ncbi:MAG: bile acid:sodium symporter family protein [Bacteroidota bacterium]
MIFGYSFIDILINLVLALIMLGIGLSLILADFKNIFAFPRSLITALGVQLFLVPIIAFAIASVSGLSGSEKVGIVIVSLCASGASSNLITHLFKGNVALAISMTTINSFITLISIPFLANLALYVFMDVGQQVWLPVPETILQIFVITIIPAGIGVFIRMKKETWATRAEKPLKYILPLLLLAVFTLKIFLGKTSGGTGITLHETLQIIPFMLLLNFFAMLVGFLVARLIKLSFADQFTISIEVGLHNTALALLIAGTILKNPEMEKPAVVYAMFSFFTVVLFVYIIKLAFRKKTS